MTTRETHLWAISLWQPWATLVVIGPKRLETRSWSTRHLGRVLIHASARSPSTVSGLSDAIARDFEHWSAALHGLCQTDESSRSIDLSSLPTGALIGSATIEDCYLVDRLEQIESNITPERDAAIAATLRRQGYGQREIDEALRPMLTDRERAFGDYSNGRYAWRLGHPQMFVHPVPYRGRQRLFRVPSDVVPGVAA